MYYIELLPEEFNYFKCKYITNTCYIFCAQKKPDQKVVGILATKLKLRFSAALDFNQEKTYEQFEG